MAKKTHDLDEFDFDDFGFDNDDFGFEPPKEDRTPVARGVGIAKEAGKQIISDKQTVRDVMRAALPKGYLEAFDVVDRGRQNARSLYNEVMIEIAPGIRDFKKATRALVPKVDSIIPKKLAEKLRKWSENDEEAAAYSKAKVDQAEISDTLSEIFDTKSQQDQALAEQQTAEQLLLDKKQEKRSNNQLKVLSGIQEYQARIVGYQDQVLAKYHRKTLELQYLHYFATRDLLEVQRSSNEAIVRNLTDVVKNTGLPDYLKINLTEDARKYLRQRMFGKIAENYGDWAGKFKDGIVGGIRSKLSEQSQNFNSAAAGLREMGEMSSMTDGLSDAEKQQMKDQGIATLISTMFSMSGAGGWVGKQLGKRIPASKKDQVDNIGAKLSYFANNWQTMAQDWASTETDWDNPFSFIVDSAKGGIGQFGGLKTKLDQVNAVNDQNPVPFTGRAERSLVEIIPGYLARLLQSTEAIRTGNQGPLTVYNYDRGEFTSNKVAAKDAFDKIIGNKRELFNKGVDEILNNIDEEKRLSPEARKALRNQLVNDIHKSGQGFSPKAYSKASYFKGVDPEVAKELASYITDTYGVQDPVSGSSDDPLGGMDEGLIGGSIRRLRDVKNETLAQLGGTTQQLNRKKRDVGSFNELRSYAPELGKSLSGYANSGQREILRLLGLIKKEGTADVVDDDSLWRYLGEAGSDPLADFNEDENEKGTQGNSNRRPPRNSSARRRRGFRGDPTVSNARPPLGALAGGATPEQLREIIGSQIDRLAETLREQSKATPLEQTNGLIQQLLDAVTKIGTSVDMVAAARMNEAPPNPAGGGKRPWWGFWKKQGQAPANDGQSPQDAKISRSWWDVRKYLTGGFKAAKWTGSKAWGLYTAPLKLGWGGAKMAGRGISSLWGGGKAQLARTAFDVYIKGVSVPALTRKGMLAGEYTDVLSKKTITCFADITGPVVDKLGNQLISEADFKAGLHNAAGKTIWPKLKKAAGVLGGGLMGLAKGYLSLYTLPIKLAYRALKGVSKISQSWYDVYVAGELKPRLEAYKLRAGQYISQKTGKPIFSLKDIDGPIMDQAGNIVLAAEDFAKLVDIKGRPIKSLLRRALGKLGTAAVKTAKAGYELAKWGGKKAWHLATAPLRLAKMGLKGLGKAWDHGFGFHLNYGPKQQTQWLERIYGLLDERLSPRKRKIRGDVDGDGTRENSWGDILKKRKEKAAQQDQSGKPVEGAAPKKTNIFTKLLGLVTMIGGGISTLIGKVMDVGTWLKDGFRLIGTYFAEKRMIDAGVDLATSGGGKKGILKKSWNFLARNAKWLWTAGRTALGIAATDAAITATTGTGITIASGATATGLGATIMGGLTTAATWATGALASIGAVLASPFVIGAVVVGGIAVSGYILYKKLGYIGFLRMAQYGFIEGKEGDKDHIEKVRNLENVLEDHVVFDQDGKAKLGSKVPWDEVLDEMGYTPENSKGIDAFQSWMTNRFAPIYLVHRQMLNKLDGGRSLDNVDHMDDEIQIPFVEGVTANVSSKALNWTAHPFRGDPLPPNEEEIERLKQLVIRRANKKKELENAYAGPYEGGGSAPRSPVSLASTNPTKYSYTTQPPPEVKKETASDLIKENMAAGYIPQTTVPGTKGEAKPAAKAAPAKTGGAVGANDVVLIDEALVDKSKREAIKAGKFIWTEADSKSIDPLASVRMRAYGLSILEVSDIAALTGLEQDVDTKVSYGFFGGAEADVDADEYYLKYAVVFGCSPTNKEQKEKWTYWFTKRFVPVLLTFHEAIKLTKVNTTIKDAWRVLKPKDMLKVAQAIVSATTEIGGRDVPVWTVDTSPFPKREANTDSTTTEVAIEGLKAQERDQTAQEKIEQAKKPKTNFTDKSYASQNAGGYGSYQSSRTPAYGPGGMGLQGAGGPGGNTWPASGPSGTPEDANYSPGGGYDHPGGGSGGDVNSLPMPQGDGADNVMPLLLAVAKMVGVDPHLLATMCAVESDFKISAKAGTSSASGLFQFITDTWNDMVRKYGSRYGLSPNASRNDPRANALMGAEYIRENYESLARSIGRKPNANDLYMAHFLGAGGAKKVLTGNPNDIAARLNPKAAAANASVFYKDKGKGAPRTVRELQAEIDRRMKSRTKMYNIDQYAASPNDGKAGETNFDIKITDGVKQEALADFAGGTTAGDGGLSQIKAKAAQSGPPAPISVPGMNGSGATAPAAANASSRAPAVTTPAASANVTNQVTQASTINQAQREAEAAKAQARAQQAAVSRQVVADSADSKSIADRQLQALTSIDSRLAELVTVVKAKVSSTKESKPSSTTQGSQNNRELRPEQRKSPVAMGSR